jgi:prepilin-type N-terminal cleavage/methylation domain-containing protein
MNKLKIKTKGFTLVELMIVVAIIGILAAVAVPKFGNLIIKSKEGATKGNLGAIRSSLAVYYSDNQGFYPSTIDSPDFIGTNMYMDEIPQTKLGDHTDTSGVTVQQAIPADNGGWWYEGSGNGKMHVGCTHADRSPIQQIISSW